MIWGARRETEWQSDKGAKWQSGRVAEWPKTECGVIGKPDTTTRIDENRTMVINRIQVTAVLLCVATLSSTFADDLPRFDRFYGYKAVASEATGFFRVEEIGGRWWFITPEGHPFFSTGVNVVNMSGTATKAGRHYYREAAEAKYATREAWAEAQHKRLIDWGWNTIGAWSDWNAFRDKMPYTFILYMGDRNWEGGPKGDPFDPAFRESCRAAFEQELAPLKEDPYLLGVFLSNEMKWGPDHRGYHLLDDFMKKPAAAAGKVRLIAFLEERYETIDALKEDFRTPAQTWDALAKETYLTSRTTPAALETQLDWSADVAEAFFKTTNEEFRRVDPNHLNLGVRSISQFTPRRVIEVAGRHVDVMSINFYEMRGRFEEVLQSLSPDYLPVDDCLAAHYKYGRRPILISEWGYRAADVGLPNSWPPIYPTLATQKDRAEAYEADFRRDLAAPYIIGQHWFLFADQPPEGRFDGEDNNFGLVNEKDEPYEELVNRSKIMYNEVYRSLKAEPLKAESRDAD